MNDHKILSLDGSGLPSYKHPSKEFGLAGVIIDEKIKVKLEASLKKSKKKFFNDEEVVLHSREISRKIGVFSVLKFTIVDKEKAKKQSWLEKTIAERSYVQALKMFATLLKKEGISGKIVTESDKFQDEYLIKAHNTYQSTGIISLKVSGKKYNEMITSLSLVNKHNLDPEVQLADLLGATARLRYRIERLKSKEKTSEVEKKKLRLIERKLKQKTAEFKVIL